MNVFSLVKKRRSWRIIICGFSLQVTLEKLGNKIKRWRAIVDSSLMWKTKTRSVLEQQHAFSFSFQHFNLTPSRVSAFVFWHCPFLYSPPNFSKFIIYQTHFVNIFDLNDRILFYYWFSDTTIAYGYDQSSYQNVIILAVHKHTSKKVKIGRIFIHKKTEGANLWVLFTWNVN